MTNNSSRTTNAIETEVLQTWHDNASAWTSAVRTDQIASRRLVTNQAIIDAVLNHQPRKVLDLGCGDGWRRETWQGIGEGFRGSAPWYYRTRTSWQTLFDNCHWQLRYCLEPKHPQTLQAASIIFCLEPKPRQAI